MLSISGLDILNRSQMIFWVYFFVLIFTQIINSYSIVSFYDHCYEMLSSHLFANNIDYICHNINHNK